MHFVNYITLPFLLPLGQNTTRLEKETAMFLVQMLNRQYVDKDRYRREVLQLPEVEVGHYSSPGKLTETRAGEKVVTPLSKRANIAWSDLVHRKIPHFSLHHNASTYGGEGTMFLVLMLTGVLFIGTLFTAIELSFPFMFSLLFVLGISSIPNEIWSWFALSKVKLIVSLQREEFQREAAAILAENQADLDLMEETKANIEAYKARLSEADITCTDDSEITPQSEASWRPVDVQYHNIGDSPFDRDATITLSSDEHDGTTCVLPGEDTIKNWLNEQLDRMSSRVHNDTHTKKMLERIKAEDILADVWQPPSQVLAEVAKMVTATKQPFENRPTVTLHGKQLPNGHVMVQAIGFNDAATGEVSSLMFAPTEPVIQLAGAVESHLLQKGTHPALLAATAD